jgi:hypothetical protein
VRPWRRWESNIKTDIKGIKCDCADWIQLAQDMVQLNTKHYFCAGNRFVCLYLETLYHLEKLMRKDPLQDLSINRNVTLNPKLKKLGVGILT